jgi:hypothetical protein
MIIITVADAVENVVLRHTVRAGIVSVSRVMATVMATGIMGVRYIF